MAMAGVLNDVNKFALANEGLRGYKIAYHLIQGFAFLGIKIKNLVKLLLRDWLLLLKRVLLFHNDKLSIILL